MLEDQLIFTRSNYLEHVNGNSTTFFEGKTSSLMHLIQ